MAYAFRVIAAVAVVAAFAGCGGGSGLGPHALGNEVETVRSLAAEGALVAGQVAGGAATRTFVKVHASYLHEQAVSVERTLSTASVSPSLAARRVRAASIAARVERDLGRLQRHPGDQAVARRLELQLERAARQAERLAG
jgi:hypothetical protein